MISYDDIKQAIGVGGAGAASIPAEQQRATMRASKEREGGACAG